MPQSMGLQRVRHNSATEQQLILQRQKQPWVKTVSNRCGMWLVLLCWPMESGHVRLRQAQTSLGDLRPSAETALAWQSTERVRENTGVKRLQGLGQVTSPVQDLLPAHPTIKPNKHCEIIQPCLTLQPKDCSPPGSSVQGIFQARMLEWFAISFSSGSFLIQ